MPNNMDDAFALIYFGFIAIGVAAILIAVILITIDEGRFYRNLDRKYLWRRTR